MGQTWDLSAFGCHPEDLALPYDSHYLLLSIIFLTLFAFMINIIKNIFAISSYTQALYCNGSREYSRKDSI